MADNLYKDLVNLMSEEESLDRDPLMEAKGSELAAQRSSSAPPTSTAGKFLPSLRSCVYAGYFSTHFFILWERSLFSFCGTCVRSSHSFLLHRHYAPSTSDAV